MREPRAGPSKRLLLLTVVLLALGTVSPPRAGAAADVTLRGQIVCSVCWTEADRTKVAYGNQADLECGAVCSRKGIPPALAVQEGAAWKIYVLDKEGKGAKRDWLADLGKTMELSGTLREKDGKPLLRVERAESEPFPGSAAPAAEAVDLEGKKQTLASLRGKVVVLNFWATWCGPCRKEMPFFVEAQKKFNMKGVQVVGWTSNDPKDGRKVADMAKELDISFPIWIGAGKEDFARFGLPWTVPGTIIIDREGRLASRVIGGISKEWLEDEINRLSKDSFSSHAAQQADH